MQKIVAGALCLLGFLAGCGPGGPQIVEIEGTVTHNGELVPNLRIYFEPGKGRPSWAISDAAGHFKLDYDLDYDGALVGQHTVWVVDEGSNVDPTAIAAGAKVPKRNPNIGKIIEKYGKLETSPLKVDVQRADKNFPLKLD
jgi:hypothetical protein